MTNDTGGTNQGGGKDSVAGKGQPRSEGESIAPDNQAAEGGETPSAGDGKQDLAEQQPEGQAAPPSPSPSPPPPPADDDPIQAEVLAIARSVARAEAVKPLEGPTVDLYSNAPDKVKARKTLEDDYRNAAGPEGELGLKFSRANEKFERTAKDMGEKLDTWISENLNDPNSELRQFLQQRAQIGTRLAARAGKREGARAAAQRKTKQLADNFAAWSQPVAKIGALIGEYVDSIDKLNADINNEVNRDRAIFNFWFDIAPKHLQLRTDPLVEPIKGQVEALKAALAGHEDVAKRLDPGLGRDDGSLFFLDPNGLKDQRIGVLCMWRTAAEAGGDAEAEFKHRPDDAAALKPRWDKLKGDAWIKDAAAILDKAPARP